MAQTKHEIQALLAGANMAPRHRFGQNFMIDQNLLRLVSAAGQIASADWIIEVGPGTGTLTEELLASPAQRVVALEIDRDLASLVRVRFESNSRFSLIEGDALAGKHQINAELAAIVKEGREAGASVKLVANLPYNIASPLVIELLIAGVELLAFTVQKEVADRFRAIADSDDYGPLTVMAQSLGRVQVLRTLPAQAFWPAPRIESALVQIVRDDQLGSRASEFSRFVHALFSARRKTLRKALDQAGFDAAAALQATHLDGMLRPENLSPERLRALFQAMASPRSSVS
jgi:16S rRNA (adenine1518-N6/adenine1519-N6)-dimethyltransferase